MLLRRAGLCWPQPDGGPAFHYMVDNVTDFSALIEKFRAIRGNFAYGTAALWLRVIRFRCQDQYPERGTNA